MKNPWFNTQLATEIQTQTADRCRQHFFSNQRIAPYLKNQGTLNSVPKFPHVSTITSD